MSPSDVAEARRRVFVDLVTPWLDPLRRYLVRRTDPATADDVLAEVLVVLWRRCDDIPPDGGLAWAIGVARRQLGNAGRGERRRGRLAARLRVVDDPGRAATDPTADWAEHAAVREQLAALDPVDAEVLRLWAWDGLRAAEIGTVLGISANAAAIRLHRARLRFRDRWERAAAAADMSR